MLARPERLSCIECGTAYGSDQFHYYEGRYEHGPAYWSDRGLLCSPACSLTHHVKRKAEGSLPERPVADPFDLEAAPKR